MDPSDPDVARELLNKDRTFGMVYKVGDAGRMCGCMCALQLYAPLALGQPQSRSASAAGAAVRVSKTRPLARPGLHLGPGTRRHLGLLGRRLRDRYR